MENRRLNKPWTKEDVLTVIQYPRSYGWIRQCARQLERSPAAVSAIEFILRKYVAGEFKYVNPHLREILHSLSIALTNGQAAKSPPNNTLKKITKGTAVRSASEIAEQIDQQLEKIRELYIDLGKAIIFEQQGLLVKELGAKIDRIKELEGQLEEANKAPKRPSIKDLFNI